MYLFPSLKLFELGNYVFYFFCLQASCRREVSITSIDQYIRLKLVVLALTVSPVSPQGVTYCGESSASSLTMANVPWHQEVVAFVKQLADMLPQYEIACEHEHSNCLLIAHTKVRPAARHICSL